MVHYQWFICTLSSALRRCICGPQNCVCEYVHIARKLSKFLKSRRHKRAPVSASRPAVACPAKYETPTGWPLMKHMKVISIYVLFCFFFLHHLHLRTEHINKAGLKGFSSFQSQACKIFVLRIYMSLRASCSTHLMSAFDKSANSKARGLEKLHLALGGVGGRNFCFSSLRL